MSAFARYRAELELLSDDERLRAAAALPPAPRGFSRFFPDRDAFARVVFGDVCVEARGAPGAMRLTTRPLAADPALPGLAAELAAGGRLIRYHPGRRCTVARAGEYGKVLAGDAGPRLLEMQRSIWAARAEFGFAVAEPRRYDARTRTLWLAAVAGEANKRGQTPIVRLGAALAALHRSRLRPQARFDPTPRTRERARELARRVPGLREDVDARLARIAALHARARPVVPVPIHGAPHLPQWLLDGDRLGLVDFDGLALGAPEWDVAVLEVDLGEALPYPGTLDPHRLQAFREEQRIARALRAAGDLRLDGDRRAARRLSDDGATVRRR